MFRHLQDAAAVSLVEDELLLEQRVQGAPRRGGLRLGQTFLTGHEVDLQQGVKGVCLQRGLLCTLTQGAGRILLPGLLCRPRARITSTSKFPRLSTRLSWMSPNTGEPSTCTADRFLKMQIHSIFPPVFRQAGRGRVRI